MLSSIDTLSGSLWNDCTGQLQSLELQSPDAQKQQQYCHTVPWQALVKDTVAYLVSNKTCTFIRTTQLSHCRSRHQGNTRSLCKDCNMYSPFLQCSHYTSITHGTFLQCWWWLAVKMKATLQGRENMILHQQRSNKVSTMSYATKYCWVNQPKPWKGTFSQVKW